MRRRVPASQLYIMVNQELAGKEVTFLVFSVFRENFKSKTKISWFLPESPSFLWKRKSQGFKIHRKACRKQI